MSCSDFDNLYEFWANLQIFDGVNCYYASSQLGGEFGQVIMFITLGLAMYAYTREPIVPAAMVIMFGAIFIAPLPAAIVNTAMILGVLITAAVLFLLVRRARSGVLG